MTAPRALLPVLAAALGLLGAAGSALFLHQRAQHVAGQLLYERLRGAGESTALLAARAHLSREDLRRLRDVNALEAVSLLDPAQNLLADAEGHTGGRPDLLRLDPACVESAVAGSSSVHHGYDLEGVRVGSGCFPVRGASGAVEAVLVLEAGEAFFGNAARLDGARDVALSLSALGALALALLTWRWSQLESARAAAEREAARAQVLREVAAAAAHEIRNPLGIVRATVELLLERLATASEKDRAALRDVLAEVERLRQLTEDLVDLSADRPLQAVALDVGELVRDAADTFRRAQPGLTVSCDADARLPASADPGRLRQVLLNLLQNAAQAAPTGQLRLSAREVAGMACVRVEDDGPGIGEKVRAQLFSPFATGRSGGTGLGLAVSRKLMERQGGTLGLADSASGAVFELRLPLVRP